jgi:hypothetical protein
MVGRIKPLDLVPCAATTSSEKAHKAPVIRIE